MSEKTNVPEMDLVIFKDSLVFSNEYLCHVIDHCYRNVLSVDH